MNKLTEIPRRLYQFRHQQGKALIISWCIDKFTSQFYSVELLYYRYLNLFFMTPAEPT